MDIINTSRKTKALQVANYFIYKNNNNPKPDFTNKKLQKLLYYSQAWNLVINKERLFDDKIEAWIHGPSIPSVYQEFKEFGSQEIKKDVSDGDFDNIGADEKKVLDAVWEVYGKYDSAYLEALTHSEEPWQKARVGLMPYDASSAEISIADMRRFYEQKSSK